MVLLIGPKLPYARNLVNCSQKNSTKFDFWEEKGKGEEGGTGKGKRKDKGDPEFASPLIS